MPNGTIRINKELRYFRKDHFCPNCRKQLNKVSVSKVVNSHSPEAKDYPFHMCRTNIVGDVLFTWDEFECPSCNTHFTVDEIKASEGIAVRAPKSKTKKWLWYAIALLVFLFLLFFFSFQKQVHSDMFLPAYNVTDFAFLCFVE